MSYIRGGLPREGSPGEVMWGQHHDPILEHCIKELLKMAYLITQSIYNSLSRGNDYL